MAKGTIGGIADQNVFKVNVRFKINQQECQTGFKLRDVAVNDNSVQDVIDTVVPWVNDSFRTILSTADAIVGVDCIKLHSEEGAEHLFVNLFGTQAQSNTQKIPGFIAVGIALKTSIRKRYGQGRMFWPIRDENLIDQDFLNAAGVTAIQGVIDALTTLFTGDQLTHDLLLVNSHEVLAPRAAHGSTPARLEIPPTWYDVDVVKLNTTITGLRSRKVGIGA